MTITSKLDGVDQEISQGKRIKGSGPPANGPRRRGWIAYIFIAPAVIYLAVFVLAALAKGIALSFTDTRLLNPSGGNFVGADNYKGLITSSQFWDSIAVTLVYTVATVFFALIIGTAAAVLVNRPFRGRALFRAIMTLPYAVPTVAVTLIFIWIYNKESGVLNMGVEALGFGQVGWLTDPSFGMISVVLTTVWKVFPFVMIVMLAALQSVPDELFEATRVDGADGLSAFRAIVLPHILPTVRIVALLMTIWSIRRFEIIYLLTGGGPVKTTNTLVINIYNSAFTGQKLGVAAAMGVLGLFLSLGAAVIFSFLERRGAKKEGVA